MTKKTIIFIGGTILLLALSGCGTQEDLSKEGRPFEDKAQITYTWSGSIEGEETFYIDGDMTRSNLKTTTSIGGQKILQNRVKINDGKSIYDIDMDSKIALKKPNVYAEKLQKMSGKERVELRTRALLLLEEGEKMPKAEGEETVAGKTCKVYSTTSKENLCIWQGIVLRNEIVVDGGKAKQKATKIEELQSLPDGIFSLPDEITVEEL